MYFASRAGIICVLLLSFFVMNNARGGLILDQQFDDGPTGGEAFVNRQESPLLGGIFPVEWAQTFTAGVTGDLWRVDLRVGRNLEVDQPLFMDIRTVNAGLPTESNLGSNILASMTIPASAVPIPQFYGYSDFTEFTFSSPAPVIAGEQYAIVLRSEQFSNPPSFLAYRLITASTSFEAYTGGAAYVRVDAGWEEPSVKNDIQFRTFVAVPEPSSMFLLSCFGGVSLAVLRRRRKLCKKDRALSGSDSNAQQSTL
jgi:hypothetical protein